MKNNDDHASNNNNRIYLIAWGVSLLFYFMEYAVRSSPSVMIPELSRFFGVSAVGVSAIAGTYYYTYAITSLIAGIALDRAGAKYAVSLGVALLGLGCILFALSTVFAGDAGRLLQGFGSAFAFPGCVYLATKGFSPNSLATAIGLTQCLGMLGGTAGQFIVGPLIHNGLPIVSFWIGTGVICLALCAVQLIFTPAEHRKYEDTTVSNESLLQPYKTIFSNLQSYLCGLVSGLLFAPTTVFIMIWGIEFFEHDRMLTYQQATLVSSMVPLGWVIGCPLLGWFADFNGRRKVALVTGCLIMLLSLAQLLYMPTLLPAYITMLVMGIGSGAAMIPYSIIKEVNPDKVKGSATGAINFITFGVTALIGPVFSKLFGKTLTTATDHVAHFRSTCLFWMGGIALAIVISLLLKETGRKVTNGIVQ
jgi:MFS family permease